LESSWSPLLIRFKQLLKTESQATQKDLRGKARSFVIRVRGSCSKNEHDFREPIERNEAYEVFSALALRV
jgi:hypothetical protein